MYFVTEGATPDVIAQAQAPEIVKLAPENGATEVDPSLKGISVTFNIPMGDGMSWTGGGPEFPEIPDGQQPNWSQDKRTCTLPVTLKSGHKYRLGLNSVSHVNFQRRSRHSTGAGDLRVRDEVEIVAVTRGA